MQALCSTPVALCFLVAAGVMLLPRQLPERLYTGIGAAAAGACVLLCGTVFTHVLHRTAVVWFGGWTPTAGIALGIAFAVDPAGAGLASLASILSLASFVFSWRYFETIGPLFTTLMLTFLGAMIGFSLTGDLFNMFVFFELMSVAAYALTAYKVEEDQALVGGLNFAITNSVGAFLVLFGIAMLYSRTGALNLAQIGRAVSDTPPDALIRMAFVLLMAGFLTKAAAVPLHFWLADAHAVAPTPVCVLFSGVMVELGVYAAARCYWTIFAHAFSPHAAEVRGMLASLAGLTALVGAAMCFAQRHIKRLLAFSTVGHMGVLLAGLSTLDGSGASGVCLYVVSHAGVKASLFLCAGILLNRFGSVDEGVLHGRARSLVGTGLLFTLGGLALAGMPPFGTALGKAGIDDACKHAGLHWMPAVLAASSILTGGAVLRVAAHVFLGLGLPPVPENLTPPAEEPEVRETYRRAPMVMLLPAVALLFGALLVGVLPGAASASAAAGHRFVRQAEYASRVLEGAGGLGQPAHPVQYGASGLVVGLASAASAALLALAAVLPGCAPLRNLRVLRGPSLLLRGLRELHSGQVGDYVTWLMVAVAAGGSACALLLSG